jgi:protein-disulfide isomerase
MPRTPSAAAPTPPKKKPAKTSISPRTAQLIAVGVVVLFLAAITAILISSLQTPGTDALPEPEASGTAEVQRADSHSLTNPAEPEVTLVEFLDFQCPACASAAVAVSQIKAEYGDRVDIIVRNFPLTNIHPHAVDAALAFEAAAAQGATVEMYEALYATQQQWSAGSGSQAATFRDLADQLGLDLAEYDRVVADSATLDRVALDRNDAIGLGLQSTPSFFIDGELVQISSFDDLRAQIEAKLG